MPCWFTVRSKANKMPILKREDDLFPDELLDQPEQFVDSDRRWWCIYTRSRREKELMRQLKAQQTPFYAPVIPKRYRSPNGRLRTSFIPLFPNYVFVLANDDERSAAMKSNCISSYTPIADPERLVSELRQIWNIIQAGVPLTPEARLEPGAPVRVRSGPFAGYEGHVIRREGRTRLLLAVRFLEQGASMEIDEGLLEPL